MPELRHVSLPFDSDDYEAIQNFHDDMQAARKRALANPLKPNLVLPLKLVCKAKMSPMSRTLPWFAKKERTYNCELLGPLQEGLDKYSQVWIARVEPIDGTEPVVEGTKIVLKIIQPSLNIIPHPEEDWSENYICPEQLAVTEDQTYSLFEDIQGIYVPYYYWMQEITTPSGENAWVLAMEYIDGDHVEKFVDNLYEQSRTEGKVLKEENVKVLGSLYQSMTDAMKAIVNADVMLVDVHARNFIVIRGTESIVVIDFARLLYGYHNAESRKWGINVVGQSFLDSFRGYKYLVMEWVNNNVHEDMRGYYKSKVAPSPEDAEIVPV